MRISEKDGIVTVVGLPTVKKLQFLTETYKGAKGKAKFQKVYPKLPDTIWDKVYKQEEEEKKNPTE